MNEILRHFVPQNAIGQGTVIASPFGFAQAKLREAISSILVQRLPRRPDGLLAMTNSERASTPTDVISTEL